MNLELFLTQSSPLLDVRSPSEFLEGHIPGAISFPLFTDEERAIVGTLYKKEGKEVAIKRGLQFVGPKLSSFVEEAELLAGETKQLRLYCARGGMRSSSLSWLLTTAGFETTLLQGGYKSFRKWVLERFSQKYSLRVLGGFTGTGKTDLLLKLKEKDFQVIDLEALAAHRGSSFGQLEKKIQPSTEHFENILARQLFLCDPEKPLWIEDESRMIGMCCVPQDLWEQMTAAPFFWMEARKEERIGRLVESYGHYPVEDLIASLRRLTKKMGLERVENIVKSIQSGDMKTAVSAILEYYDQAYLYSSLKRHPNRMELPSEIRLSL
ncbi:MAG: tRNA 2-selenouridine(34) synthase MnmH [Chlamydiota bacterium]